MNGSLAYAFVALLVMKAQCFALMPPLEPHSHSVKSANGRFYARMDVKANKIIVKEVRRFRPDKVLWSMNGYFEHPRVAGDGTYLVDSVPLIGRKWSDSSEVIWIYWRDGARVTIPLRNLITTRSKPRQVMGGGAIWGGIDSLQANRIKVVVYESKILYIEARTGQIKPGL